MADENDLITESVETPAAETAPARKAAAKRTAAKKAAPAAKKAPAKRAAAKKAPAAPEADDAQPEEAPAAPAALFVAPEAVASEDEPVAPAKKTTAKKAAAKRTAKKAVAAPEQAPADEPDTAPESADASAESGDDDDSDSSDRPRRRRRRGGRRRRKGNSAASEVVGEDVDDLDGEGDDAEDADESEDSDDDAEEGGSSSSSRRRRRTRSRNRDNDDSGRSIEQQITAVSGSTRLEAKKQRRREGREAGRRRAPIVSEAEFLARRESVERVMVVRQRGDLTQIGVLEDKVLVEHYVARESQTSLIGNVYLGRVQNVLPSMEAAFIDIGKGRNAVLYAGEVNWAALGHREGEPRKIESVLTSGQPVLVQVTKDPIGHKGARLTSQISLAGRFVVYVPDGSTSGISRKLPDTERNRLKTILKEVVPDTAGVIVRTAAEGASEEELTQDVERLKARWADIEAKSKGSAPQLLYGEPDLTLKVVRDLFTEDFARLVVEGEDAWLNVKTYVDLVAPDLAARLERFEPGADGKDVFASHRVDEQIAKGLDRKVWLPSGGSLIIDRTEAMTVIDVNTGKFTGSGGNLEETVTKNNLEAAEEVVRQLRLRDIGGIVVVDFIDMVLESNRDLVLRRLVECLGRDRTRHQVAEVTSLGLVQMTRKRIGTGLLEAFSETCEHCLGRGVVIHDHPVEEGRSSGVAPDEPRRSRRGKGGKKDEPEVVIDSLDAHERPSPAVFAAMAGVHVDEPEAVEEGEAPEPVEAPEPEVAEPEIVEDIAAEPVIKVTTRKRGGASRG